MLLEINPENPQLRLIQQVVEKLNNGAVIASPTDTGYGIGCDIFNQKAIRRIQQITGRPENKPFSFMCSDLRHISEYAHVSNTAYRLLKKCLPGPYTFVLPGTKLVPRIMLTKQKTVGIRVPGHPISRLLIATLGHPLLNASVPTAGDQPAPSEPFLIDELIGNRVDLIIDGGRIVPDPSSVVDLTRDSPEILRVGKGDISLFR
ncbi:threonylcarbamoyl-AMP synthase [Desulfoprunum benzoelyticum]|uniref:tRNA threonylcarbamoyl adenosine modification protein (Sua5/YciO/YrdC/YwlC family) n=1 Tax=Desulfoprunum benzoelyticum TaxID=1506996 RepID=A0A840V290_9BACT|nr:L-threonylcarbamoyladenylate synthase [Desulfoprunum benzoelyticum]MBB5347839.1 tRNA threonylcarbamoyl adenosine modification protein (Sua5/YciO/YrdC/YwlC family) [Desulfoprunum benzoelyticum]MBM9530700.1 threonylcarbamoyl-AMP synthase [Desulfoprunum benzoelyticum]